MQPPAKSISSVCIGRDLDSVKGTVSDIWSYRSIEPSNEDADENEVFEDDGPLFTAYSRVFNVTIAMSNTLSTINVFFYDKWADECKHLLKGEDVTISGSHTLVLENSRYGTSAGEHACCIAVRKDPQCQSSPNIEVTEQLMVIT